MKDLKQQFEKNECWKLQYSCLSTNYWYLGEIAVNKAGILKLIDVLSIFIKQKQTKIKKVENTLNKRYKNDNSSWAGKYSI